MNRVNSRTLAVHCYDDITINIVVAITTTTSLSHSFSYIVR